MSAVPFYMSPDGNLQIFTVDELPLTSAQTLSIWDQFSPIGANSSERYFAVKQAGEDEIPCKFIDLDGVQTLVDEESGEILGNIEPAWLDDESRLAWIGERLARAKARAEGLELEQKRLIDGIKQRTDPQIKSLHRTIEWVRGSNLDFLKQASKDRIAKGKKSWSNAWFTLGWRRSAKATKVIDPANLFYEVLNRALDFESKDNNRIHADYRALGAFKIEIDLGRLKGNLAFEGKLLDVLGAIVDPLGECADGAWSVTKVDVSRVDTEDREKWPEHFIAPQFDDETLGDFYVQ